MKLVRLPSRAMIVALVAVALSVGGNVTAAVLITSVDIKNETIRSVDIRDATIKGKDVGRETLTGVDVANKSLGGVDVANNSLTGADVLESALGRVPSAANAANAAKLDGLDANSLIRVAGTGDDSSLTLADMPQTYGPALSITAPTAGFVVISGWITIRGNSCTTGCDASAFVLHSESAFQSWGAMASVAPGSQFVTIPLSWVIRVNAGVNTLDARVWRSNGNGELVAVFGGFTAIFSPFGSTGGGPFATDTTAANSEASDGD